MTQPAADPWAAAGVSVTTAAPVQQTPAQNNAPSDGQGATGQAALAGAFAQAGAPGGNLLFTPQAVAPSLFNKTHGLGTELTGIVVSTPTDRQEQDFNAKKPKYFSKSKVGGETRNKPTTTDPIDGPTGLPNDPIMGTHIELSTDYRMTAQEIVAVGGNRDVSFAQQDDGKRVLVITGKQAYKAFFEAIQEANTRGLGLTGYPSIVGKRITAKRVGQTPNPGGTPSWVWAYRIDAA